MYAYITVISADLRAALIERDKQIAALRLELQEARALPVLQSYTEAQVRREAKKESFEMIIFSGSRAGKRESALDQAFDSSERRLAVCGATAAFAGARNTGGAVHA